MNKPTTPTPKQEKMARKIRYHLERRIADVLECEQADLPPSSLGNLFSLLMTLIGDTQSISAVSPTLHVMYELIGKNAVWSEPEAPQQPATIQ